MDFDDGHYMSTGAIRLSTESYTYDEVVLLVNAMVTNFNIKPTIQLKNKSKGQYIIYIFKSDVNSLRSNLLPHMPSSMHYKLGL